MGGAIRSKSLKKKLSEAELAAIAASKGTKKK